MRKLHKENKTEIFKLRQSVYMDRKQFGRFIQKSPQMILFYENGKYNIPKKTLEKARVFVKEVLEVYNRYLKG